MEIVQQIVDLAKNTRSRQLSALPRCCCRPLEWCRAPGYVPLPPALPLAVNLLSISFYQINVAKMWTNAAFSAYKIDGCEREEGSVSGVLPGSLITFSRSFDENLRELLVKPVSLHRADVLQ